MTPTVKAYIEKLEDLNNHLEDGVDDFTKSQWDRRKILYDELADLKQQIEAEEKTDEICDCCGKPMTNQRSTDYLCMNPECDNYIKMTHKLA